MWYTQLAANCAWPLNFFTISRRYSLISKIGCEKLNNVIIYLKSPSTHTKYILLLVYSLPGTICDEDINECASQGVNNCSVRGFCVNTIGGFFCGCRDGFELQRDGISCDGKDTILCLLSLFLTLHALHMPLASCKSLGFQFYQCWCCNPSESRRGFESCLGPLTNRKFKYKSLPS